MSDDTLKKEDTVEDVVVAEEKETATTASPVVEEKEEFEVPAKFKTLVEQIEKMSVLELNELVKLFEKKFGVSASAVSMAMPGAGAQATEEKTEFDVVLVSDGGQKIPVMKVIKDILALGLKEAKDMVEALPANVKTGIKKEEAEEIKKKIEEAGGKVEVK